VDHECDRCTDSLIAYAALEYVARPKMGPGLAKKLSDIFMLRLGSNF